MQGAVGVLQCARGVRGEGAGRGDAALAGIDVTLGGGECDVATGAGATGRQIERGTRQVQVACSQRAALAGKSTGHHRVEDAGAAERAVAQHTRAERAAGYQASRLQVQVAAGSEYALIEDLAVSGEAHAAAGVEHALIAQRVG